MELIGIAVLVAGLMGSWHVAKHAVPRTMRAVGGYRRQSIARWRAANPGAPAVTRWAAGAGRTLAAMRWGPKFLGRETKRAWKEGVEASRTKYGPPPAPAEPATKTGGASPVIGDGETETTCVQCGRDADGPDTGPYGPLLCQRCADEEDQRRTARRAATTVVHTNDNQFSYRCNTCGQTLDGFTTREQAQTAGARHRCATPSNVVPIRARENTVTSIQTATGGEITNAEQFLAEAKAIASEAAAEMEDAAGDAARAEADLGRVETMVASLTGIQALSSDIAAVAALKEPAVQRAAAARDRVAAADKRLAGAKVVEDIAAKHVQLIGTAAGSFYNAA